MRTIRQQLTRKLLFGFALLLGAGGFGVYFSTRTALLKQFDATLRAKATAISTVTEQNGKRVEVEFSDRFMREFGERVATDFFEVWLSDGSVLRRSESLGASDLWRLFGTFDKPKLWNCPLPSGFAGRAIGFKFLPRVVRPERLSTAPREIVLVVASDRRGLDRTLATLGCVLFGCGVLLLAATMLLVPRVLRDELAPLNELADQAARVNADSLATRFSTDSMPAELRPISSRLNDLLARLEQSFERERQFSADLAHELRTPIAELRSLAELALKWPEAREAETDREVLAVAVQMEGLVTRLLALLRSERGQLPVALERVALGPLVEKVWRTFAKRAASKQLKVVRDVAEKAEFETDPVLACSILANLVDNAIEYTPAGGLVRIEGEVGTRQINLRVSNTVENLTADDLPKLFDRFWRKDLARAGSEHSGLGLPLARAFARALGGELAASLDGQSSLTLTFSSRASVADLDRPPASDGDDLARPTNHSPAINLTAGVGPAARIR
jgi:signal transduction histidine kinase